MRRLLELLSIRRHEHDGPAIFGEREQTNGTSRGRLVALGGVVGLAALVGRRYSRVEVQGPSMIPVLDHGDRLLVRRTRRVRVGDIIVFRDPEHADCLLVKRVVGLGEEILVAGDNQGASRDSRSFGPIETGAVKGVAYYCYAPRHSRRFLKGE